jgi:protein TonB
VFNNLIESSSHKEELARKGRFFLGTMAFYALLFAVGGVASIYAYDAHLENQSLEIVTLLPPIVETPPADTPHETRPSAPNRSTDRMTDVRRVLMATVDTPALTPDRVSSERSNTPPVRPGIPTVRGDVDTDAAAGGPIGPHSTGDGGGVHVANAAPRVLETEPPPAMKTPTPAPTPIPANYVKSLGAVTGQMLNRPTLNYPPMAKVAGIQGPVNVQVVIDESGKVISAHAVSGSPILRQAAEQAAYQARFSPTTLSHQPVKASGTITFNFILQR